MEHWKAILTAAYGLTALVNIAFQCSITHLITFRSTCQIGWRYDGSSCTRYHEVWNIVRAKWPIRFSISICRNSTLLSSWMKLGCTCTEILFSVEISNQISIRFYFLIIMSEAVVLDRGQLYRPEATPRAYTADGGPIWLFVGFFSNSKAHELIHLIS
jgi:hypothetical protein